MPGVIQELDLLINQASVAKAVAEAQKAGSQIGAAVSTNADANMADLARRTIEAANAFKAAGVPADQLNETLKRSGLMAIEAAQQIGKTGAAASAASMDMAKLATASSQISQGVNPMTAAMSAAAAATTNVGGSAGKASPLINKLTPALSSLASQAVGVPGPLGRVASLLLQFSAGGIVTLGVVAGLGLIVMAWNKVTEATRKARAEADSYAKQAAASNLADLPERLQITAEINQARASMATQRAEFAKLEAERQSLGPRFAPAMGGRQLEIIQQLTDEETRVRSLTEKLGALKQAQETATSDTTRNAFVPMFEAAGKKVGDVVTKLKEIPPEIVAVGTLNDEILAQSADAAATAVKTGAELAKGVTEDLRAEYGEQNAERIQQILSQGGAEADAIRAIIAAHVDLNDMLAKWDKDDAARNRANHIEYLRHLEEQARRLEDIVGTVTSIATAWGLVNDATAQTLNSISQMATDTAGFAASVASGDVLGAIQSGVNVIGDIGGIFVHRNKDPGRFRTNQEWYEAAIQGDASALENLRIHSVVSQGGRPGWGSPEAAADAAAKYAQAKRILDQQAAPQQAADAAAAAEQAKQDALERQRIAEEGQVQQHESQSENERRQALVIQARALGLGGVADKVLEASHQAALAGQGALGREGPLAREAQKKADDLLRDLEGQVQDALRDQQQAREQSSKDFEAGGIVQRSLTEASAGAITGNLVTIASHTSFLPKLYDLLSGKTPQGAVTGGIPAVQVILDGQTIEPAMSARQHGRLQQRQSLNGNSRMT